MERRSTATSNFGVSKRESHDASGFYNRFADELFVLSDDDTVPMPRPITNPFVCGDARDMSTVESGEVALVVTSPPYFAGKQYEEELSRDGIPASYGEYLQLLEDVFAECARTLEPGGRIAINVANLGRKPYRSLAGDVVTTLQRIGLLMRGEIVWQKGDGASGSCAWGSYRSPANPVLRDLTERVLIASKGRFDRAKKNPIRKKLGLPYVSTLTTDGFMDSTLDVWNFAAESAKRVNHPAPFPIALPERLIHLYTYENDLVLDPFMGSGTTLVAAARTNRRYVGYDLDPSYCSLAADRVANEGTIADDIDLLALPPREQEVASIIARHSSDGLGAVALAEMISSDCGFSLLGRKVLLGRSGVFIPFTARTIAGVDWRFVVGGSNSDQRSGLTRMDAVWRVMGQVAILQRHDAKPFVVVTPRAPKPRSEGDKALRAAGAGTSFDVIDLHNPAAVARLRSYATMVVDSSTPWRVLPGF